MLKKINMKKMLILLTSLVCTVPGFGATIFDIDFEDNNFDEWTGTVPDSGDLSVEAGASLAGTNYGMQVTVNDTTAIYAHLTMSDPGSKFRMRWYFDQNSSTFGTNFQAFAPLYLYLSGAPNVFCDFTLQRNDPDYNLKFKPRDDSGSLTTSTFALTDEPHYIEFYMQRATGVAANDGAVEWWVDGVSKGTWSNVDNWDMFPLLNLMRAGAPTVDAAMSGSHFIDQLKANDDGSQIGAHSPAEEVGQIIIIQMSILPLCWIGRSIYRKVA